MFKIDCYENKKRTNKMSELWFRENRKGPAVYVDLFRDISDHKEFEDWDKKNNDSSWKKCFLHWKLIAKKNNVTAQDYYGSGNIHFRLEEWRKAMEMFNLALHFVEPNAPLKAELYGKRGFCFFNMNMHRECLTDMDLSLACGNLSAETAVMVSKHRTKCLINVERGTFYKPYNPSIDFDQHDKFPCMANILQIEKVDECESPTNIIAKSNIEMGKIVLIEEAFSAIAVGYNTSYCFTCLNTVKNFIPCPNCSDVMFCSDSCMNRSDIHNLSCGATYHRMPSYIKFVLQTIFEAITSFSSIDDLAMFVKCTLNGQNINVSSNPKSMNYALFFGLPKSSNDLPTLLIYQVYTTLLKMPLIGPSFKSKSKYRFLMHLVAHHVQVLLKNSYGGFEKNQNQFITARMNNVTAMIEHSCTANLVQIPIGNKMVLITVYPVKAGDHLTINYWLGDIVCAEGPIERQEFIYNHFGITCKCDRCMGKLEGSKMWTDPTYSDITHSDEDTSEVLKQQCVDYLERYKYMAWSNEKDVVVESYIRCLLADINTKP